MILEKIKEFAGRAHGLQKRKYTDEPYIVHPVRVMEICRDYTQEIPVLGAALLHDVLEDTRVRQPEILAFLERLIGPEQAAETVRLVEGLTDQYTKENYPRLNRRKRKELETIRLSRTPPAVQTVKYADLIDNALDIVRHEPDFARVYLREASSLLKKMDKGNPALYRRAVETISKAGGR